ncbi:ComF family protein [Aliidiomarina celeris]|uniref:ComF family protein n=1 Tax=Aliidiomarina celeris TaxID=2249428 RepID=UPI000DE97C20|nr:ComF family protein [Aliidiomarina celeris]
MIRNRSKMKLQGRCILCEQESAERLHLCAVCFQDLTRCPPVNLLGLMYRPPQRVRMALAPLWYQSTVKRWLALYKFRQGEHEAFAMAELIAAHAVFMYREQRIRMPNLLLAVPQSYAAWYQRGFNQAQRLADHLGDLLGIEVCHSAQRVRTRGKAHKAGAQQRRALLAESFKATEVLPKGSRVALVDDVITTGATLGALASVLPSRGVVIDAWALAYTPPPSFN